MSSHQLDEERIFHVARDIGVPETRDVYLDQVCAGDQALRERVEELLRIHEQEQSFLKSNGDTSPTEAMGELNITSGQQIGRYRLLQKIGEGGFGVVFMAEQNRPVRRKVALKVIKPGMDSQAVVARFEAERQALAMMDHPNIARVFDGGATEGGRPYFVMELVKGVPITEYCDKNELSTEQRLRLFTTVCQAVQHAHQKGIIHRDLKPSNVLVTLADGEPVVKVIDFGVAKAINQQLTEKTLFTAFGQMVGTPQYMSPEQAEMSCLDVDTRSDVYSLGVLLYELLTGTTPLEAERLRTAGYAEMQRIIREEEPPKPSTRLSTSGDKLTILAKHRKVTPEKLKSQVKGDLDWIVMKALEKDRNRRYASPLSMAEDVDRALQLEPVEACPPSTWYRLKKLTQRHRISLISSTIVATALILASILSIASAIRMNMEMNRSNLLLREYLASLEEEAMLAALAGNLDRTMLLAEKILNVNQSVGSSKSTGMESRLRGIALFHRGDTEEAIDSFEEAVAENSQDITAKSLLAVAYWHLGRISDYEQLLNEIDQTPKSDDKYAAVFRAHAEIYRDQEEGFKIVDNAVDDPTWAIGQATHATISAHLAVSLRDEETLRTVSRPAIENANRVAPANDFIQTVDLLIRISEMRLLSPDDVEFAREKNKASRIAAQLDDDHLRFPAARRVLASYYLEVGEFEKAKEKYFELADQGIIVENSLPLLLNCGATVGEIKNKFAGKDQRHAAIAEAFLLAQSPSKHAEAIKVCDEIFSKADSRSVKLQALNILLFLGRPDLAQKKAKSLRAVPSGARSDWIYHTDQQLSFLANPVVDTEELVGRSTWGPTLSDMNFQIAMLHFSQGEKAKAIEYFKASLAGEQFGFPSHLWSRYMLQRINEGWWPDWIKINEAP